MAEFLVDFIISSRLEKINALPFKKKLVDFFF